MRCRKTSRPLSSATISIFVPPRSIPNRMLVARVAQLRRDEGFGVLPALRAEVRVLRRGQQRLEAVVADEMDARHVRRVLRGRSKVLRNVVDEEGRTAGTRRQCLDRLAF